MISEDRNPQLDSLFERYREACGSPEAGPNFMPLLWQSIEGRQSKNLFFEKVARTFVASALALCCLLGISLIGPLQQPSAFFNNGSYVEVLQAENDNEVAPFVEPVRLDLIEDIAR